MINDDGLKPIGDTGNASAGGAASGGAATGETVDIFPKQVSDQMINIFIIMSIVQTVIAFTVTIIARRNNV